MKYLLMNLGLVLLCSVAALAQASDASLRSVVEKDRSIRTTAGKLQLLSAAEHLARGKVYFDNRQFPEAREHLQKILENYPTDSAMSGALFMTGRSHMWEREYKTAIPFLLRVAREYPSTKDGREGLSFAAACHVRIGSNAEAAKIYEQYTVMYPTGERIDSAYLNIIDALREAGSYEQANQWVDRTRTRFPGMPTETNALHARLRMEVYRQNWTGAQAAADALLDGVKFAGSMTSMDEVKYLKALAIEQSGRKDLANSAFASIPFTASSYYGGLAADRLRSKGGVIKTASVIALDYPTTFGAEVVRHSKKREIDPRFVLAIMKQESAFRPGAKSPAAARGLLQLVYDTAIKYNKKAGIPTLQPDDLYDPATNIAIGCEYIAALKDEFGGLYEAIAASYNGGEDNAARWLNRSKPKDPGVFAAEVGFSETKHYVSKVMNNYRRYRELYDENLNRRS